MAAYRVPATRIDMRTEKPTWRRVLEQLAGEPVQIGLAFAGGGGGAVAKCFGRSGASQTFVEAVIPYSRGAMAEYLSRPPDTKSVTRETATALATMARRRAMRLSDVGGQFCPGEPSPNLAASDATVGQNRRRYAGIGLTAALPTDPPRPGKNQIHVALEWADAVEADVFPTCWSVEWADDSITRMVAESISDELVLHAIATLVGSAGNEPYFRERGLTLKDA